MRLPFDRNEADFPTPLHREAWWWGIGIVPAEESLTEGVRAILSAEEAAGCLEWREWFAELSEDVARHPDAYRPASARQLRDLLETATSGAADGDAFRRPAEAWDRYVEGCERGKPFRERGLTVARVLESLSRTGFAAEREGDAVAFRNARYPLALRPMRRMADSPKARDTLARAAFAECDFRWIAKPREPDARDLMRRAGGEATAVAEGIREFAAERGLYRYAHYGLIKYRYRGERLIAHKLYMEEAPRLRVTACGASGLPAERDLPALFRIIEGRIGELDRERAEE